MKTIAFEDILAERCINCKSKKHVYFDELIGEDGTTLENSRFDEIEKLEEILIDIKNNVLAHPAQPK